MATARTADRSTSRSSAIWRTGAIATAVATVVNVILYALAVGPLGMDLVIPDMADRAQTIPMPVGAVIVASMIGGALGTLVRWVISRARSLPEGTFPALITAATVLSLLPILSLDLTVGAAIVLASMHFSVGIAILTAFRKR